MSFFERRALEVDYGLRTVAGGSDQGAATLPSTGLLLAHRRLAEAAAVAIVDDVVEGGRLGPALPSFETAPDGPLLAELVLLTTSEVIPAEGREVDALSALWSDIAATSTPQTAWKGLLTALLADPARLVY